MSERLAPVTLAEIERAAELLRPILVRTPLVPLQEDAGSARLWLKPEIFQPSGSFKVRGVFHAVARLDPAARARGISTVSAGNTARALAWCGRHFGVRAVTRMPEGAPATKIAAVERLGGEVVRMPKPELFRYLEEHLWEQESEAFIHPWIERDVIVGHATLGLEIVRDLPEVERLYVPVGGGGLIAGVASALRALGSKASLVAVEPADCAALAASLDAGRPVRVDCRTVCDGVAVPFVTDVMFEFLRGLVDETRVVSDARVLETVRRLALEERIVTEPSGALALAAALADSDRRGPAVCLATGGSIDTALLLQVLAASVS